MIGHLILHGLVNDMRLYIGRIALSVSVIVVYIGIFE